jgi:hypothetical protein
MVFFPLYTVTFFFPLAADEWELEQMNDEIEWENDFVEMLSNASVMQQMEVNNKGRGHVYL